MLFRKTSARRLAVRENVAEAESLTRPSRSRFGPALLIVGLFFILATAILYYPGVPIRYHVGDRAPTELRSPVDFTIADPTEAPALRAAARANTLPILVEDTTAFNLVQNQLDNLPTDLRSATTPESLPAEVRQRWPGLTTADISYIHYQDSAQYHREIDTLMAFLRHVPIVDVPTARGLAADHPDSVSLAKDSKESALEGVLATVPKSKVIALHTTDEAQRSALRAAVKLPFASTTTFPDVLVNYLLNLETPLYRFDPNLTEKKAQQAEAAIQATGLHIVKDQPIVLKDQLITAEIYQRLELAQQSYDWDFAHHSPWLWFFAHLGKALAVLLITCIGALYVTRMNRALNTVPRAWALAGLLIITLFIAKIALALGFFHAIYFLGIAPTLIATIILVIAYNQRFALVVATLHGLLVTLALSQSVEFFLTIMAGASVFAFGLTEIRTRGKLIEVSIFAAGVLFLSVWALSMARFLGGLWDTGTLLFPDALLITRTLLRNSLCAGLAGILAGTIMPFILNFIESLFRITTAMTLLELCDLNQPLLKRLSLEAPGTFNHSLIVGTMAEAAGNAIGANGLLCRVGSYYHDIGKLSKPLYFIENQAGGPNRHDKLSPAMSLLIIVGHVKDGIELAREYRLPPIVHQFIGQHHGTTLVEYFYHTARERQARETALRGEAPSVSEAEFRYPGPKPQTRETAIMMICDGVESICRSLAEPTAGRIESAVHALVMKRLMDGQFSECDLTLRDLSIIESSLTHTMAGVYHGRLGYPKAKLKALTKPA